MLTIALFITWWMFDKIFTKYHDYIVWQKKTMNFSATDLGVFQLFSRTGPNKFRVPHIPTVFYRTTIERHH